MTDYKAIRDAFNRSVECGIRQGAFYAYHELCSFMKGLGDKPLDESELIEHIMTMGKFVNTQEFIEAVHKASGHKEEK